MRKFCLAFRVAVSIALLVFVLGGARSRAAATASAAKPNVLFIAVDDLNHWVGYLGRNKQTLTPNIDRLAKRGTWFTRSYCPAPVCNPSRAAIMSGLRPATSGVYDNGDSFVPVVPENITLTAQFRKAGYRVTGAGKIYHGSVYRAGEWDDWFKGARAPEGDGSAKGGVRAGRLPVTPLDCEDSEMADYQFVSYAIEQLQKSSDQPFFVACGLTKPHLPWSVPRKYYEKFPLQNIALPPYRENDTNDLPAEALRFVRSGDHRAIVGGGSNAWKQAIQAYLAAISFSDAMVGRLLEGLDKSPHATNTIVCFWSDHGWHLGEKDHWRKFALWEESTRAPLIWVVPGVTAANSRCERTVDHMSIYPTLMDLCGLPLPSHVQGKSIKPLLIDSAAPWNSPALTTFKRNNHSVRSEQWRYTRYADGGEELYNEVIDPYEWTNLASTNGAHAEVRSALSKSFPATNAAPARATRPRAAQN